MSAEKMIEIKYFLPHLRAESSEKKQVAGSAQLQPAGRRVSPHLISVPGILAHAQQLYADRVLPHMDDSLFHTPFLADALPMDAVSETKKNPAEAGFSSEVQAARRR